MSMALSAFRSRLEAVACETIPGAELPQGASSDFMQVVAVSRWLSSSIGDISDDGLRRILDVVEDAAANGEEAAKNAATTGFLEHLQNRAASDAFPFARIVPMLGTSCLDFCRAWDDFAGVRTPGLDCA